MSFRYPKDPAPILPLTRTPTASSFATTTSRAETHRSQYSLGPSPQDWGVELWSKDPDDDLHNPQIHDADPGIFSARAFTNMGCLVILFVAYPLIVHFTEKRMTSQGGFNLGGINASGQLPEITGNFGLIDRDTPKEFYTKPSYTNPNEEMVLVFSDEFNEDGRTFYPGDDPFWEAVDLYYAATQDLEWYDPSQATTQGGALRLRMDRVADPSQNHNLTFRSGMLKNKFCFTGGILEARVMLPGSSSVSGLWPAVWSMGNLGRAGYGGSVDGMWPYTYDSCDVGTLANQSFPGTQEPAAAFTGGDPEFGGQLSLLPGQRLSACTCAGEDHPGPIRRDGTYVGRAAPEIDVFEAIVDGGVGHVSLSTQWAPYNAEYRWNNNSDTLIIYDAPNTVFNTFIGSAIQQTTSGLATTNQACYERSGGCFAIYGFEYKTGFDDGYITWVNDNKLSWTVRAAGLGPDPISQVNTRPVPPEPMYIIANLGISPKFGTIDLENLIFPATMSVDYIRVYQPAGAANIGCDPPDYPTADYINRHMDAYTNANFTLWSDVGNPWPKNKLIDQC
ncbi:beta-glucan synthesis-associated protein SKN1 [Panaeolus papilionaceus]|nr:beta-glucan synthesis-associated protein SKN1 [Panaeolus papilionaceus]